ncbi:centrosomal protein of 162 kDa [Platysternon megacephalum]|uniref:Centrosomal protein of 162 kDa n=1 Tax=Platysternon megacephalum TaxID=55544 RepID=A0A4D9EUB3_9SAUR|nr:centrosomal protein of 162 kDa [Platysternon megacephalum]
MCNCTILFWPAPGETKYCLKYDTCKISSQVLKSPIVQKRFGLEMGSNQNIGTNSSPHPTNCVKVLIQNSTSDIGPISSSDKDSNFQVLTQTESLNCTQFTHLGCKLQVSQMNG